MWKYILFGTFSQTIHPHIHSEAKLLNKNTNKIESLAHGRSISNAIHVITKEFTTLNIVFSVTYYLESCNVITIYCTSHFQSTKVKLVV